jgi:hypothetical protein
MPVDVYVQEAEALRKAAELHRDPLQKAGLDPKWIGEIAARVLALAGAQSAVNVVRERTGAAKVKTMVGESEALRTKVVGAGRYVLRKDAAAQATLDRIQEGDGIADLCQDMRDVALFARTYGDALSRAGVTPEAAEKAEALASALAAEAASAKVDASLDRAVDVRNRAFTYADEAIDEVRAAGRFAFAGDADGRTIAMFRSSYALKRGRRTRAAKEANSSNVSKPLAAAGAATPSASAAGGSANAGTPRQS